MGSIEAGKLADLVVLDKPYLEASDEELKHMHPLLTMVGGRVVHARAPFGALAQDGLSPRVESSRALP